MKQIIILCLAGLFLSSSLSTALADTTGAYPSYSGQKRMAVIMLNWSDRSCPATRQQVVDRVWNSSGSTRKYYRAMSRNLLDFVPPADAAVDGTVPATTTAVYGPYTLSIAAGFSQDVTYANADSLYGGKNVPGVHSVAQNLAAADGYNAGNYDYIMYITPKTDSTGTTGGYASIGATYSHLFDFRQNYINHEIGHNLMLHHSNTSFDVDGYGSQDCVMGNAVNTHIDGPHSYFMGWYPDVCFPVRSYGQYEIENLAQQNTDNAKVLRFDRGAHGATSFPSYNLWIEYRVRGVGYDNVLDSNWDKKVNIHYCPPTSRRPTDGGLRAIMNNNMSKFAIGGTYTEPDNKCTVKFVRATATHATVQLINPSGNQPPTISAQSFTVSPGTTNFTVPATDPNGNPLTYTIVTPPAAGTLTRSGSTFTYTGSTLGTYTFIVRVNDGQYDSLDATMTLNVALPLVSWTAASQSSVGESGALTVTAQLSTAYSQPITVPFTVTGTATVGSDYSITTSPITITAGATTGSATITITSDTIHEVGGETVILTMGTPTNATKGATTVHTATIKDDDNTAPVVNAGPDQTVALSAGGAWTPALATISAWYDAADTSTITSASGTVSQWRDKSGNSRNLNQATVANQPATGATINSLNALDFTGDVMTTASNPFGATINNAFVIAVHKVDAVANGALFSLTGSETVANRWNGHAPYGDGVMYFDCGAVVAPNRINTSYGVSAGNVVLASFYCSTTENVQQVYKNGNLLVSDASGHAVSTVGNIMVGGFASGYQDTTIGEFIIINGTVDAATRQKLEGYLAHKWGLTANLPAAHPYKAAAPTTATAVANLDGTVSDANGDPLMTTWTQVSGPAAVPISNASAVDTTATFTAAGTYTLRLTANDGYGPVSDDVVINVSSGGSSPTVAWTAASQASVGESGTLTVTAQLSAASTQVVTVPFTVTGTASSTDRTISVSPITIAAGATIGTATITITADTLDEPNETVILTMGTPTNATAGAITVHTATITDDDVNTLPVVNAGSDQTVVMSGTGQLPWTPADLSTAAWFDAADTTTIQRSGTAVTSWLDKSGNGLSVSQTTAGNRPASGTRTYNGKNVIDFVSASGQYLTRSNTTVLQSKSGMMFVVAMADLRNAEPQGLVSNGTTGTGRHDLIFDLRPASLFNKSAHSLHNGIVNAAASTPTDSLTINRAYLATATWAYDGTNTAIGIGLDGTSSADVLTSGFVATNSPTINIGMMNNTTRCLDGFIGEVVIVSNVDADDRLKMEGYLAHKWGLTANLPAGHPYKSVAPTNGTASVNLDGTVSDVNGDPLTTTWSLVSGPGSISFANTSAVDTSAELTVVGTYTFRLTANDGFGSATDDVVITVNPQPILSAYDVWVTAANLGGGVDGTFNGDANGDGIANGLGWLLGATNPNENGSVLMPQTAQSGGDLTLSFKMLNSTQRGTAVLSLQYSNDLGVSDPWTNHTIQVPDATSTVDGVSFVITPIAGTDHNQVQVTIPASAAGGTGKVFARMRGVISP